MESIGEQIRNARVDNKLTQSQLAEKLSVSLSTIVRWEHDYSSPNIEDFKRLSEILSVKFFEDSAGEPRGDRVESELYQQIEEIKSQLLIEQKNKEYAQKERDEALVVLEKTKQERDLARSGLVSARRKNKIMLIVMVLCILMSIAFVLWMIINLQGVSPDDSDEPAMIVYYEIQKEEG